MEDALRMWNQAMAKRPSPQLAAALSEVHFRRGVRALVRAQDCDSVLKSLADLERVRTLAPDDWRPLYYMGVAHHLLGDLEQAQVLYRQVLDRNPNSRRTAYRIALAALERRHDPAQSQGWALLDERQQADLLAGWRLLTKKGRQAFSRADGAPAVDGGHPLWVGLAVLDGRRPDKKRAKEALERAMGRENEDAPRFRLAQAYMGALLWPDDPSAAARHWDRAARKGVPSWMSQNHAVGAELLARCALESGDADTAYSYARIALDYDPDRPVYREVMGYVKFHLGNCAARQDRWDEAVEQWTQAYQLGCKELGLVHNLALGHERLERWTEAVSAWREFLRRRPRRADAPGALSPQQEIQARRHIASLYWRVGREKEAVRFYRQVLSSQPEDESNAGLRVELADLLASHDRWRKAEQTLHEGLKHHPNHPQLLQALGLLYEEQHRGTQAQEVWEQLLEVAPDHPIARDNMADHLARRAWSLEEGGKFDQARVHYERAIEYAPQNVGLKLDLADLYYQYDKRDEAIHLVEEAMARSPNDPSVLDAVVRFWISHDEIQQADGLLQEAEGSSEGRAGLCATVGMAYCLAGQEEKGEALILQAVRIGTVPHLTAIKVAVTLLRQEMYALAVTLLEQCLYEFPGEPVASIALTTAYVLQGKRGRARQVMKEARYIARQMSDRESASMLEDMEDVIKSAPASALALLELIGQADET